MRVSFYSDSQCTNELGSSTSSTVDFSLIPYGEYNIYYKTSDNPICSKNPFAFSHRLFRSTKGDRIDGGTHHTCALDSGGEVLCGAPEERGDGAMMELLTQTTPSVSWTATVVQITWATLFKLAQGVTIVVLLIQVERFCVGGRGDDSQLGNDGTAHKDHPVNVVDGNGSSNHLGDIVQITAGSIHACALNSDGEVLCWGAGGVGRLGDGGTTSKDYPVHVVGTSGTGQLNGIVQISAGGAHTCALSSVGEVLCWGQGTSGQLGNDVDSNSSYPVYVVAGEGSADHLGGIVQISSGNSHTCALTSDREVLCWGDGVRGQLGNDASGTPMSETIPSM